jgi:hypothetical protein
MRTPRPRQPGRGIRRWAPPAEVANAAAEGNFEVTLTWKPGGSAGE